MARGARSFRSKIVLSTVGLMTAARLVVGLGIQLLLGYTAKRDIDQVLHERADAVLGVIRESSTRQLSIPPTFLSRGCRSTTPMARCWPARSRAMLRRALLVLGPTEALLSMGAFLTVLSVGGWTFGDAPSAALLSTASGTAFAVIAASQIANVFACRSETRFAWRLDPRTNPFVVGAVAVESGLLLAFLGTPWLADQLGGSWPSPLGWLFCALALLVVPAVDATHKAWLRKDA